MQNLNESYLGQKVRELRSDLTSYNYFNPGRMVNQNNPSSGFDMGSRTAGATSYSTGVPTNPRHRQYFGMSTRPSSSI